MSQVSNIASPQSYASIEGKATALHSMLSQWGITHDKAFPIVEVLEHVLPTLLGDGYYFGVATSRELDGAEAIKTPEGSIIVRDDVYELALSGDGRSRFTLAHELGHLVLHPHATLMRLSLPEGMKVKTFQDPEWQADAYAAAILMPRPGIVGLTAEAISERFRVSLRAAEVRLKKMKNR